MINEKKIADRKDFNGGGKLFNFRPCLFAAIFLCLGICFARGSFLHGLSLWWSVLPLSIPLVIAICYKKQGILVGIVLSLAFLVGFCGYWKKAETFSSAPFYDQEVKVYGKVVESEFAYATTFDLVLDNLSIDGKTTDGKLFLRVDLGENTKVCVSDWIFVDCSIRTNTALSGKNAVFPDSFAKDIRFSASSSSGVMVVGHSFDLFSAVRQRFSERLYQGMDEKTASVCFAILTGDTSNIEEGLLKNVRAGGIAHVFAVSGLHVGTLFGALMFLLEKRKLFNGKNLLKFSILSILLLFYGGVCGFTQSVLRAVITCLCAYAFKLFGAKNDMIEGLSFAVILLLVANSAQLFCLGFQLSFAACFGIGFLAKPLAVEMERGYRKLFSKRFEKEEFPANYLREERGSVFSFLSVTIAAQVSTAPILLQTFHYLSGWGLLLNVLFVPLIGVIFSATLVFTVVASLLPAFLSGVLLYVPNLLWAVVLLLFQTTGFSVLFEGVSLSFSAILFYYAFFLFLSDKFNLNKKLKRVLIVLFFLLFYVTFLFGF